MEADTLTIAYYDEDNKWEDLIPYITSQLPLTEIFLPVASSDPCKIYPKFTRHEDSYWEVSFEEAFRKPYLWIYVLNFTTFENFRQKSKPQIREMVNTIMEQQIEWLVLFLHPLAPSFKSQHKGIMKSYEKVAVEIGSMFGLKQCVKLFCNEKKFFLSSDCPVDSCKGYLDELIKSFNQGISISLGNRIAFFAGKISQVEETRDYNLFVLMKEGLAMTYSIAGLKQEAKNTYEQIFTPPDCFSPINFGPITEEELLRTSEISMKEFRSNNGETSHLYLRKYIFYCQKKLLEADEDYIGIGHLSLSFVCTSLGLFKSVETEHLKTQGSIWVYNHSLELAKYLQEKSKSNEYPDITDPEVRTVLHYSVGLMLSLVRSRLQILSRMKFNNYEILLDLNFPCEFSFDRSPVKNEGRALKPKSLDDSDPLEVLNKSDLRLDTVFETQYRLEEALHILTFSLFENFSQANYPKFAQRYRIEEGILLTYRGMFEQAGEIMKNIQDIEWDSIQVIVLHNLLTCFISTGKHFEAVAAALKICRYAELLHDSTIPKLWNTIEEISYIHKYHDIEVDLFKAEIGLNSSKHQQGDIIEVTCRFLNTLKCPVVFGKVFCQFYSTKNNGTLILEAKNIRIEPGLNNFKLSGVASAQGRLKAEVLHLVMNKLNMVLSFPIISVNIEASSKFVTVIHKVPSLLVYNEVQLLAIEISTRHYSIECGSIELANSEQIIFNKDTAECISYTKEGKDNQKLQIHGYSIQLPKLPSHSRLYIILEIKKSRVFEDSEKKGSTEMCSSLNFMKKLNQSQMSRHIIANKLTNFSETVEFHAELQYMKQQELKKESSSSNLDFILPLTISSKFCKLIDKTILQIQILNCSHLSIKTISWSFSGCEVVEDPNCKMALRTGQIHHLTFILNKMQAPSKFFLIYSSALKFHDKKMHIDPVIDRKMKEQQFSLDHVFYTEEVAILSIIEPVVFGKECEALVSLLNGKTAKLRVEKSAIWKVLSNETQEFINTCKISLVPTKAGNVSCPEVVVWLGERNIKIEGPKTIFVLPIIKSK